jgi:hypothetical protein
MCDQYNNDTCLPNPAYVCSDAGYPAFVVNASTPDHVRAGINFGERLCLAGGALGLVLANSVEARKHNVRLIVKGTGHDYQGRSAAPNSLSIWTHHMQGMQFHHGSFKPNGCSLAIPGNAVTVAAGSQMIDIYRFTDGFNQTVVGGGARTVGVGGYVTGGGHSILAPRFGLAADQVLEMEMVTPGGNIITINECKHTDLFWAMRGVRRRRDSERRTLTFSRAAAQHSASSHRSR